MKIKSIKRHQVVDEPVFNLTVANDPTYHVEDVLVHNCRSLYTFVLEGEEWETDQQQVGRALAGAPSRFGGAL